MKTMKITMKVFTCDLRWRHIDVDVLQEGAMISIPSHNAVLLFDVRQVVAQ